MIDLGDQIEDGNSKKNEKLRVNAMMVLLIPNEDSGGVWCLTCKFVFGMWPFLIKKAKYYVWSF